MKTYFNFLSKNKFYTFVTVLGFAISLVFVFLIAVYTTHELTVDKFHEKGDRLFILANDNDIGTAYRIGDRIKDRYPEIEEVVPILTDYISTSVPIGDKVVHAKVMCAAENFFEVFSFPLLKGEKESVLKAKNSAVISESFARREFPGKNPLGETISFDDSFSVTISGVMKDINNSTIRNHDILIRMDNVGHFNPSMDSESFQNAGGGWIAVLAKEGVDIHAITDDMAKYFKEIYWIYKGGMYEKVRFLLFKDFYYSNFDSHDFLKQQDKSFIWILMTIGIVILMFAIFNYLNLTVAQTGFRAREMATRRLVGASPREPFFRLIGESLFLIWVSFIIAIFLSFLLECYATSLFGQRFYLSNFFTLRNVLFSFLGISLLGVLTGIFPAIQISKITPIDVMKGSFHFRNKMIFSRFFIVVQNVITIALIIGSIIMREQINHMISAPLGYNYKNIIGVRNTVGNSNELQPIINEIGQLASVKRVALATGTPFGGGNIYRIKNQENNVALHEIMGDSTYIDMFGLEILLDNQLANDHKNYFNEEAYKQFQLSDDDDRIKELNWHVQGKIKDFHRNTILNEVPAIILVIRDIKDFRPFVILFETTGDPDLAFMQIKDEFERLTGDKFLGSYIEDDIKDSFSAQKRLLKITNVFATIAIFISLLGLLGISIYFIQQRFREIAIKKVFGSTNLEVLGQLILSFLSYVLIAFVITVPIIWYIMQEWLSEYSYRIFMNPLYFLLGGLFCLLLSFFTIFYKSLSAANSNPIDTLKNE